MTLKGNRGVDRNRRPALIAAASVALVALGGAVGMMASELGDPEPPPFGSLPKTITMAARTDKIVPLPKVPPIPPLATTVPPETIEEPEPEYQAEEPEYQYQSTVEEKEPYVPPPTPEPTPSSHPEVTVGKNE